jgi:uncharacterized membrane protein YgcG
MRISRPEFLSTPQRFVASCSAIVAAIVFSGCAATMHLPSHWPDQKIAIDGKKADWDHTYLIEDNKLVVGFLNDSSFVYLMLATNDRDLAMSMLRGLTVWFDANGGTDETFGIHYPLGGGFPRGARGGEETGTEPGAEPGGRFGMSATELEILGPGKNDRHRMQIMETGGIQAKYIFFGGSFVYELKVPYAKGNKFPFSIGTNPGTVLGLGLETTKGGIQRRPPNRDRQEGEGEDGEGGDRGESGGFEGGGMRGGGRGGRGGFGQGGSRGSTGPLDVWMKVQLLTNNGTEPAPTK